MTVTRIERKTPLQLPGRPAKEEMRKHWPVVLEYAGEGSGPWLVDLSHCRRLDVQGKDLGALLPPDPPVPARPGEVSIGQNKMITRMNAVQACLWLFDAGTDIPDRFGITEITEGSLALALVGKQVFRIAEKLTHLDLQDPALSAPFLLQGPFCHVPCQLVVLAAEADRQALLLTCSRGYAHDMVHAILDAGQEFGLRAGGERRFLDVISTNR